MSTRAWLGRIVRGLRRRLLPEAAPPPVRQRPPGRPLLVLLIDRPDWAFDHSAKEMARRLAPAWEVELRYVVDRPRLDPGSYDLLFIYFWGETWHQRFAIDPERIIKQVSSHRWQDDPAYGPCTPDGMVRRHLHDAATITCTSLRMRALIGAAHPRVFHAGNGIDPARFRLLRERQGGMAIGWAGNADDPVKRIREVLLPAAAGYDFHQSTSAAHAAMAEFYNRIDVFVTCSRHEGEPLTLIEAMACGCFPVCADIGIVPELVRDGDNGLIVRDPTPENFRAAFAWCAAHLDQVRAAGRRNAAEVAAKRSWDAMTPVFAGIYRETLARAERPRFRNDDVSWDTDLDAFTEFCAVFRRHDHRQLHGITLHGTTATRHRHDGEAVEYAGTTNLSRLGNARIRALASGQDLRDRADLIAYLNASDDDLALHGWYHTDHARMSLDEHRHDLRAGLDEMRQLFPHKLVRYFIPPFNRANRHTRRVCAELGLTILGTDGVHLEAELDTLVLKAGTWHRYHHHRFYPGTAFDYYQLSLQRLAAMFARQPVAGRAAAGPVAAPS
jgi:hypothetical protein